MNTTTIKKDNDAARPVGPTTHELFQVDTTSRTRLVGLATVIALMVTGTFSFLFLFDLTPIEPTNNRVLTVAVINGILIFVLLFLIGKDVIKIIQSRRKGRVASRLHVRIIGLFCLVAAMPAILVAIIAGITLDLGLDRWFETRTKRIIQSSVSVARAYQNEATRVLLGNTLTMASNLDRNRRLYILDRTAFKNLFTLETKGRGFLGASLVNEKGEVLISAQTKKNLEIPKISDYSLELAKKGDPVPIPPGNTNLVGAVFKMRNISGAYLHTTIAIHPAVIEALKTTQKNSQLYNDLEQQRLPYQLAFALLYFGVCMIVLLSAIWMGISVATRIVTPIRRLMSAAGEVSTGNLDVSVNLSQSEGDLHYLSETFNEMVSRLRSQTSELVTANELMNERTRFIEAVLSGVSASVIGVDVKGTIKIVNRSAETMLDIQFNKEAPALLLRNVADELGDVFERALKSSNAQYHEQITLLRNGSERTLNVQVTREEDSTADHSFVLTLDDITDLVSAQRNTAWADVARRIAHEIKNPLTPIQLSAERIKRRYGKQIHEDREVFDNCTDTIIRQVGDIGRMVDEFSSFARMPAPEMVTGNLKNTLRETVFLQKVGFPDIEIELEVPDDRVLAVYDERMLSQALINVIKNAAEAIESVEEEQKGRIFVKMAIQDDTIAIDIIDNGIGLPKENRQRLLEPYMTTRAKGTGLGLPIVRKIIEDHGGTLELKDAPQVTDGGHGAWMHITLPILEENDDNTPEEKSEVTQTG